MPSSGGNSQDNGVMLQDIQGEAPQVGKEVLQFF